MDQREEFHRIATEQARTLMPADQVRELTNQKIAEFTLGHQEKIVKRIKSAIDSGYFKVDYEISSNASAEVMANLKSNLEAAGYSVKSGSSNHYPVWTISWDKPPSRSGN